MSSFFTQILFIPIYNLLMFLVGTVPGHQVAVAIILLTIIIRIILLPTSLKASRSMIELQKIQPEMTAVREKYKKDQKMMSQEMMALYKKHKVSPFGSCLPLIIQLVVLIIFYRVIMIGFNADHFNLLYSFIKHPSSINLIFWGVNVSKPNLWVLPLLAGALQFIQTKMMPQPPATKNATDPMVAMNKQMIYFFPLITIFIARSLPAGLAIYWVITSLVMILQQWYINNKYDLGFIGRFPAVAIAKLPEYTLEPDANPDGTEKPEYKKERAKGVEITVRKRKL
ncbi:MAG: YidC/Oxa1 family membrane protein insertase [Candidatus Berkelbacteria bacterium]|nr:YidC/Oxa1 family membrane protein insertase [Candidatus Berkelbacteria bacterium]